MSLEDQSQRSQDLKGLPVQLRNGEKWLIPIADQKPVFEKEDGQWMFKYIEMTEPYKCRYDKIQNVWKDAAKDGKLKLDPVEEETLSRYTFELIAMALDKNYDLTAEQLGDLIDPLDQTMIMSVLLALQGTSLDEVKGKEGDPEPEKKNSMTGSTEP